jgi:hypothetical protein
MNTFIRALITCMALVLATQSASADVPDRIHFAARLVQGAAPANGPVQVTVELYRAATGGTNIWTESHTPTATDGLVSVAMGTQTPFDATIVDGGALFLQVTVAGTVLTPRLEIGSVPYAMVAERADTAAKLGTLGPGDVQRRVGGTCPMGSSIQTIDAAGAVTCEADDDTQYTAGTGLALSANSFSVNFATTQRRVAGACAAGSSIRTINSDGTVVCETDTDTDTTYSTSCPAGQYVSALSSSGTATCRAWGTLSFLTATTTNGIQVESTTTVPRSFCALTRVQHNSSNPDTLECSVVPNADGTWTLTANGSNALGVVVSCEARCF